MKQKLKEYILLRYTIFLILVPLSFTVVTSPHTAVAQGGLPLPAPAGYKFIGNGFAGDLVINSWDNQGNIKGTLYGNEIIGFYDQVSGKIMFMRIVNPNDVSTIQIYTGYISQSNSDGNIHLEGTFKGFSGTAGTAAVNEAGWEAVLGGLGLPP